MNSFSIVKIRMRIRFSAVCVISSLICFHSIIKADPLAAQQQITVTGIVSDKNEPVIGANVSLKGTTVGTVTDRDGKYSIPVPDKDAILVFSFLGYVTQEISVKNKSAIDVVLSEDTKQINEVIVVGYGVQKKEDLTGAVSMVNMDKVLGNRPVTNVGDALQGAVPGLQVTGNAVPGSSKTFNIRGITSINEGDPLILVDNVPASIDMINPEDIESVSVLKDAASAAVYGARAAYGVILITTKKGRKNTKFQINYNNNFAFEHPINRPKQASVVDILQTLLDWDNDGKYFAQGQDLAQWINYEKDYMANPSNYPANGIYVPGDDNIYYYLKANDPQKAILANGFQQTHNISASGGTDKLTYRMSLGYTNNNGVLITNKDNYRRVNMSSNISADITSWLTEALDVRYANGDQSKLGSFYNSFFPSFYPSGEMVSAVDQSGPYPTVVPENNLRLSTPDKNKTANPRIFSRTNIHPLKGLEAVFEYTYDRSDLDTKQYNGPIVTTINDQMGLNTPVPATGRYQDTKTTGKYTAINTYATYAFNLQKAHNFKLMAGFAQEYNYSEALWVQRDDMINLNMPSFSGSTGQIQVTDTYYENALRSGFYRFNYDYSGKYLFEANGRYDGSSRFPPHHRFGFFPSFSIGWNITEEKWMQKSGSWLNQFKLRASYGEIGNQAIKKTDANGNVIDDYYPYIPAMASANSQWVQNGVLPITLGMPVMVSDNFTWETVKSYDVGADFSLFKNRLTGTFDWYRRNTEGMLTKVTEFPKVVGADAPVENASNLRTFGWELSIGWNDKINDWNYGVKFNLYDTRSQITSYDNVSGLLGGSGNTGDNIVYRTGMYMGEIWGYKTDRYYTIDDFQDGWQNGNWVLKDGVTTILGNNNIRPGDILFKNLRDEPDNNSVNQIDPGSNTASDPGDQTIIGNSTPRYQFGANFNVGWKNLNLSVFFQGIGKRQNWLSGDFFFPLSYGDTGSGTVYSNQLDYWKPVNAANGEWNALTPNPEYPRLYGQANNGASNYRIQSKYISNTAYMRLKNITLGYDIPLKLLKKIDFTMARIFFSAEDIYTWDHLPAGYDPERLSWGYPFYASYSFGIDITF